jgi:hypothetical protein
MFASLKARLPSNFENRASLLLALGFLFCYVVLQCAYYDVTGHSIDQIRDVAVATDIVSGRHFPTSSPPFSGTYAMPPAFYYLLAIPLAMGSLNAVFALFGLIYIFSLLFVWLGVYRSFGAVAGAFFAAICSPFWVSLFSHSAWGAGLTFSFSAFVLGCVLRAMNGKPVYWAGAIIAYALLIQIHPSALPLAPGLALAFLLQGKEVLNRWTLGALGLALVYFGSWLLVFGTGALAPSASAAPSLGVVISRAPSQLLDGQKWLDAAILPYWIVRGITPTPRVIPALLLALSLLIVAGSALSLAVIRTRREIAFIWVIVVVWALAAMGFLGIGVFWYLDVIYSWLYCLCAVGFSVLLTRSRVPSSRILIGAPFVLFILSALPQIWLYSRLDREGQVFLRLGSVMFPQNQNSVDLMPVLSARTQTAYYDFLDTKDVCADRVAGINELVFRDSSLRYRLHECAGNPPDPGSGRQYFFTNPFYEEGFSFTENLTPTWKKGAQSLYAVDGPIPRINGAARNTLTGNEKLNYAFFRPSALSDGLSIKVSARVPTLLRVALRCEESAEALNVKWRIVEGVTAGAQKQNSRLILGHRFYDTEILLRPTADRAEAVAIEADGLPKYCDVSAIARPI